MKRLVFLVLSLTLTIVLIGCADKPGVSPTSAGTVTFYSEPVWEAQESVNPITVQYCVELTREQAGKIKAALNNVEEWLDDNLVDRLGHYSDSEFQLGDTEFVYYFTYEYNVVYYDHYFAEIPAEDMQYIRNFSSAF